MKKCPNCFTQNRDDAEYCTTCGKRIPSSGDGWSTATDIGGGSSNTGGSTQAKIGSNAFIDPDEKAVASIGSGYLGNMAAGNGAQKGEAVLTQKRFYYRGRNYSGGLGKVTKQATEEGVVAVEDISYTMFTYIRPIGYLIFTILMAIATVLFFMVAVNDEDIMTYILIPLFAGIISLFLYVMKKRSVFVVAFHGGSFGFDLSLNPLSELQEFQRQIHLMKDQAKKGKN